MSMVYLPDNVANRLKETALRQRRQVGSVIQIMLDFEDQRYFEKVAEKQKQKKEKK